MNDRKRRPIGRKRANRGAAEKLLTACAVLVGLGGIVLLCGLAIQDMGATSLPKQGE